MDLRHFYFHMTMWDYEKKHEENAEWLRKLTVEKYNSKCKQSTQYVDLVVLDYFDAREEFFISFKDLKNNVTVNWIPSLKFMILAKTPH